MWPSGARAIVTLLLHAGRKAGLRRAVLLLGVLLTASLLASTAGAAPQSSAQDSPPSDADAVLLKGLSYLHQGRFAQGQLKFRSFLERHPSDPRGHLFLAFCEWWKLLQVGAETRTLAMEYHLEESVRLAHAQVTLEPENPEALTALGTAYIFLAEYRASERKFFKAASAARKGKSYLDRASRLRPDQVDSQFGLGAYNYYADKVSLLIKGLRSMLFLPGGDSELGLVQLGEVAERGRYFRTEAHLLLAVIYQGKREQRYRSSLEHLRAALALNPDSPVLLGSIGELQMRLGRYPESHAVLQRAITRCQASSDPEQEDLGRILRILLADSLDLSLHSEAALSELTEAIRGSEIRAEWRKRALAVATRAALRTGATESLQKIYEVLNVPSTEREELRRHYGDPAWLEPSLVRSLAPALAQMEGGRPDAALPLLTQLLSRRPEEPELLLHRGRLSFQQGQWDEAQVWLSKIPEAPAHTPPWILGWRWLYLGRSRWERGDLEASKDAYRRALEVEGFRGKDLARALLGPEGDDPELWPRGIFASGLQTPENPRHVSARFLEGWNTPVAIDRILAGVVGSQGQSRVAVAGEQLLQVTGSPLEVLPGIEDIADLEAASGLGHQLHQSHGPAP
ncbi:MAG: hypothetical protein AUI33_02950 [Ignavibacteria bacterium 13_1_40CM_2_61_4]|nr:MAG: hypothetical protein AUI33_02950 [Ignavibacteria bacterium 13_1_40CM_2_61_4]